MSDLITFRTQHSVINVSTLNKMIEKLKLIYIKQNVLNLE